MKRAKDLFEPLISDKNLRMAIDEVNRTHHWKSHHRPNRCTAWVEETKEHRIKELRKIIVNGFQPRKPRVTERHDVSAGKWRKISEPIQWPDQYVHHALIQIIQPAMMRGMDPYCCGSIRGRGPHKAQKAIERWMSRDYKGTKYEFCGDIHHFYDSLKPEIVMNRMRELIKDSKILDLIYRIIKDGIKIGAYTSQWFANTVLQPLDQKIRQSGYCKHYVRYMDNLTVFGSNFRKMKRLRLLISEWLKEHELSLKYDWQLFPTVRNEEKKQMKAPRRGVTRVKARMPDAVGYRYGRGFTLPRKRNFLRLKRAIGRYRKRIQQGKHIAPSMAASIISRLGQIVHCSNHNIYQYLFQGEKIVKQLKRIIRMNQRKEAITWSMFLAQRKAKRFSEQKAAITAT